MVRFERPVDGSSKEILNMQIGDFNISKDQMPSYVAPSNQPYHMYQSMQDVYVQNGINSSGQQQMPMQPIQGMQANTMESQNNAWRQ